MEAALRIDPTPPPSGESARDKLRRGSGAPAALVSVMSHPPISAADFDARMDGMGQIEAKALAVARAVIVDGRGLSEVGDEYGLKKQRVYNIVKKVRARLDERPEGWERVDVWLPPAMAEAVRDMAQEARDRLPRPHGPSV